MWMTGNHFWLRAGRDLTGRMSEGPHGEEMLKRARCVGRLADDAESDLTANKDADNRE